MSAAVQNAGEGKSEATALRYYQSTDATITATDTWVGRSTIAGLAGSGSSSQSVELTAPSSPGRYYYGACVDAVPGESDTTNNCSGARTVRVVEGPDLVVGGPFVSNGSPEAGGTFLLVVSVRNRGDATSAATTVRHYRSTDATVTSADTLEGTEEVRPLGSLQSSGKEIHLTAPSTAGTYYYGSCVDAVPDESDTTNNCSGIEVTVTAREPEPDQVVEGPDLVVEGPFVANGGTSEAGGKFLFLVWVRNRGDATSAATTVRHYRSTDATVTSADTLEGTEAVRPLGSFQGSGKEIHLTAPSTAGTYYYGSCVDAVPDESDTTNNCSGIEVTVTAREPEPDQVVQSVEVAPREVTLAARGNTAELAARVLDAQDNEIFGEEVSWSSLSPEVATVNAAGVVTAVANGRATVVASASGVSGEATVTVWQRAASVEIDPGEVELTSVGGTATVTLRAFDANGNEAPDGGDITSWSWRSANPNVATVHPFAVIDPRAQVRAVGAGTTEVTVAAETEDGVRLSGTATVTVTIEQYPDLEVKTPTVSDATPETGASFTLSATVSNAGDGESPATTLHYYQSTDATITTADTEVGTDAVGALAAAGISEESISLTAPSTPDTYYYGACADAVTDESDTTDNCSDSVPVTVSEPE